MVNNYVLGALPTKLFYKVMFELPSLNKHQTLSFELYRT
jgi:hypothetical protein